MGEIPWDPDEGIASGSALIAADRLLVKLQAFVESLDDEERQLLAALLAPGVAQAHVEPEVAGFAVSGDGTWRVAQLPESLASRIRDGRLRIEFE